MLTKESKISQGETWEMLQGRVILCTVKTTVNNDPVGPMLSPMGVFYNLSDSFSP